MTRQSDLRRSDAPAEMTVPVPPVALIPDAARPQRARLILDFQERGNNEHTADDGWAVISGPWVHWLDDEFDRWQSWPMHNVVCVEWLPA